MKNQLFECVFIQCADSEMEEILKLPEERSDVTNEFHNILAKDIEEAKMKAGFLLAKLMPEVDINDITLLIRPFYQQASSFNWNGTLQGTTRFLNVNSSSGVLTASGDLRV